MEMKLVDRGNTGELFLSGRIDSKNAKDVQNAFLQVADRFRGISKNPCTKES